MTLEYRVVKLGGSLLDFDCLAPRLRAWLAAQPPMQGVMLVGGGKLADAIRDAFALHQLSEEAAHWLCIRLLGITAELVAGLLPEAVLIKRFDDLVAERVGKRLALFEPEQLLRDEAVDPLPHSWDVTSDSIAARLAARLEAGELVLLKSDLPAGRATLQDLADAGYVDRYFPIAAAGLARVRCVNLRSEGFPEIPLRR
jgi:5-(aminomethyl)-3-furanmethanol phosphate kinase